MFPFCLAKKIIKSFFSIPSKLCLHIHIWHWWTGSWDFGNKCYLTIRMQAHSLAVKPTPVNFILLLFWVFFSNPHTDHDTYLLLDKASYVAKPKVREPGNYTAPAVNFGKGEGKERRLNITAVSLSPQRWKTGWCPCIFLRTKKGFPGSTSGKKLPANAEHSRDVCSIPRLGRSPGGGHGSPLWYSCLENPMDSRAWWATIHGAQSVDAIDRTGKEKEEVEILW